MRIVSGRYKGRVLKGPRWDGLRPTSDKLRETLFNILGSRIEGARMVDGYAGTGAVGVEALSRGAASVLFIERDRRAAALITENLRLCGEKERYTIEGGDVALVLHRLDPDTTFDVIFLDPPYDHPSLRATLEVAGRRLAPDGLLILERATRREPEVPASLERLRDVKSGDSTLTFLAWRTGAGRPSAQ